MEGKKLTAREKLFVDEYFLSKFNAAEAARNAGYSEKTAREIGYQILTKLHIKAEVQKRLESENLGAEETKKLIYDIAKADTNKYLKVVEVERIPQVKRHLSELIADLKKKIAFESNFAALAGFSEEEYTQHYTEQNIRERQILRYELELNDDPDAFRMVPGDPVKVEMTEYDLVALAKDKDAGRIKSYKMTKDGPQIEFYPADAALRDVARIHGLFDDKLEVKETGSISLNRWLSKNSNVKNTEE